MLPCFEYLRIKVSALGLGALEIGTGVAEPARL